MKRLFIAIKFIPDPNLLKIYYSLRRATKDDKIRWVEPDKFHLTLKFLGNTPEDKIDLISDVISSTVESFGKFKFRLISTGIFGSSYQPRVIWFGTDNNEELKRLGLVLLDKLDLVGFSKGRQNYVPHLTIGRITKIMDKRMFNNEIEKVRDAFLQFIPVDNVILYESILSPRGPAYKVIRSFQLKN